MHSCKDFEVSLTSSTFEWWTGGQFAPWPNKTSYCSLGRSSGQGFLKIPKSNWLANHSGHICPLTGNFCFTGSIWLTVIAWHAEGSSSERQWVHCTETGSNQCICLNVPDFLVNIKCCILFLCLAPIGTIIVWVSCLRHTFVCCIMLHYSPPARWGSLDFIRVTPSFLPPRPNSELQIAVGTAGPQPRSPDLRGLCWTSTAST